MPSVVIVEKNGELKLQEYKSMNADDLYKKCNLKKPDGFEKVTEWGYSKKGESPVTVELWARSDGQANQENKYGNTNFSSNYYVYELNDPDDLRNDEKTEPNYDGYVDIGNIALKLADENREVKNFKMQGQDFESISF